MFNTELVYVNGYPNLGKAPSLGISVKRDMVCLAAVDENRIRNIEFYIHTSGYALRACPYAASFRDKMNLYEKDFALSRLLEDAMLQADVVGFCSSEIKLQSNNENLFDIPNEHPLLTKIFQPGGELSNTDFLYNITGVADKELSARGEITKYYYNSLRPDADGVKSWVNPADRVDPLLAVARAFSAIKLKEEHRIKKEEDERRAVRERFHNVKVGVEEAIRSGDDAAALKHISVLAYSCRPAYDEDQVLIRRINAVGNDEHTTCPLVTPQEALRLLKLKAARLVERH